MERWQKQTRFYNPEIHGGGNCTEAALASFFNVPLEEMPTFHPMRDEKADPSVVKEFWDNFDEWIEGRGFIAILHEANYHPECMYLASGLSPRGCPHMVIYQNGELLHDPHPSNDGILSVDHVWVLVPKDPVQIAA